MSHGNARCTSCGRGLNVGAPHYDKNCWSCGSTDITVTIDVTTTGSLTLEDGLTRATKAIDATVKALAAKPATLAQWIQCALCNFTWVYKFSSSLVCPSCGHVASYQQTYVAPSGAARQTAQKNLPGVTPSGGTLVVDRSTAAGQLTADVYEYLRDHAGLAGVRVPAGGPPYRITVVGHSYSPVVAGQGTELTITVKIG
jgi:predicted RNA-binding Zn-ribbon protein involved in translation (DUF1610 family)